MPHYTLTLSGRLAFLAASILVAAGFIAGRIL